MLLLLVLIIASVFSSFSSLGSGGAGIITATSYLAEDQTINNADLLYTEWETGLQMQVNRVETDRPGYDEYRYQIDAIEHDPYVLMGYLTSVYRDFSASQAETALRQLFNSQYSLTFTEETEIRTRTEAAYRSHGLPPASPPQAQILNRYNVRVLRKHELVHFSDFFTIHSITILEFQLSHICDVNIGYCAFMRMSIVFAKLLLFSCAFMLWCGTIRKIHQSE